MYKFKFFGGEKIDSDKNENLKAEKEKNELELQILDLQRSTEKGNNIGHELHKENTIFVPELKPFA